MNTTQQPSLRFYLLSVVCLGILFLVGCSDKAALESVDYVLHNAQQEPVEALERIRSIDKSSIRGKHNRARYALAYSEALYYNRINSDCDTLVRPLFDYYHDSDNHEERARALYQYALVKYNSNKYPEALFAIEEAFESLDIVEDNKLRGLLYRIEGDIYNNELLFHNAYEAHLNSIEYFKKENLSAYSAYSMSFAGTMASRNGDFANAEVVLTQAMAEAINIDDKNLLCDVIYELCRIYIQTDELAKCESTLCLLETYNCAIYYESDFNCIRAILEAKKGNINLAYDYLVNAENCQTKYDNLLISRLRNEACFNDREIRFIVYSILGFSSASISLLLNIKTSAVWRLKYNIKIKFVGMNV